MRSLTKKQQKMLNQWYNQQKTNGKTFGLWWDVKNDDDFSGELYQTINDLNPCEIFYQNVNNFIHAQAEKEISDAIPFIS